MLVRSTAEGGGRFLESLGLPDVLATLRSVEDPRGFLPLASYQARLIASDLFRVEFAVEASFRIHSTYCDGICTSSTSRAMRFFFLVGLVAGGVAPPTVPCQSSDKGSSVA